MPREKKTSAPASIHLLYSIYIPTSARIYSAQSTHMLAGMKDIEFRLIWIPAAFGVRLNGTMWGSAKKKMYLGQYVVILVKIVECVQKKGQ